MPLTETDIKALKVDIRERWVNDGAGLYLRILPTGRKSWVWRTKKNGKTSYFTLGEWPALTVRAARAELANRSGRRTLPNALTVREALAEWYRDQIEPRYRVTANARVYVDRASAEFGSRRLQELTREEITRFLRAYGREAPVAANRCLSALKLALGWCVERGYLDRSPADGLTRRIAGGAEQSRARTLSDAEIRALWWIDSARSSLLRALLLTGCRIAELQKARADRIEGDWLTIPSQDSKNAKAHRVYLVPEVKAQFNGAPPLLFRSVSPTAVQAWVRRLQLHTDETPREDWLRLRPTDPNTGEPVDAWTPHDLRRTFASRMGDLGIAPHVIEKLLNHTPQGMAGIYNRAELLDERIDASRRWAAEVQRLIDRPARKAGKREDAAR